MFDFFLVHWVLFALLFTFVFIVMIICAVIFEKKRLERLRVQRDVAIVQAVHNVQI